MRGSRVGVAFAFTTVLVVPAVLSFIVGAPPLGASGPASSQVDPVPVTVMVAARTQLQRDIDRGLIGVNHVVPGSALALRAIRTRWARTDVSFEQVADGKPVYDCDSGMFNPAYLDQRVQLDRQAGADPELIVDYAPVCLVTNPRPGSNTSYNSPDVGPNAAKWESLVYKMARHEIAQEGVHTFEIWNEPDGFFWTGTMGDYLTLYENTSRALEQAAHDTGARIAVGGPALADFLTFPNVAWIDALLSLSETAHVPVDFLSWHVYPNDIYLGPLGGGIGPLCWGQPPGPDGACWYNPNLRAEVVGQGVLQVQNVLKKFPGLHPLLWLDEWNVDAGFDIRHNGTYGSAFVSAVLDTAQGTGLNRASYFDVADDIGNRYSSFGLLSANLVPKPSYRAFSFWHQLSGIQLPVEVSPDQSGADPIGRIGAVASRRRDGAVSVLVYNFAPQGPSGLPRSVMPSVYTHAVRVRIDGLLSQLYTMRQAMLDTSHDGNTIEIRRLTGGSATLSFSMEGQAVTLIQLLPVKR